MLNRVLSFLLIFIFFPISFSYSQSKIDKKLTVKIQDLVKDFNGTVGVYVQNLKTGKTVSINADTLFPTASMVKVPIMLGVFEKIHLGQWSYHQNLLYRDSLSYDRGVVGSFKDSTEITLSEVVFLMESISDNTASLWLQDLVTGKRINELLSMNGFNALRVNSRTPGRENFRKKYGWGVCTPYEMTQLIIKINKGEIFSKEISERMARILGNQFWDEEGLSVLPKEIRFMSKTGAVDRSRSEVSVVHGSKGSYAYCIVTKNQKDMTYEKSNEGFEIIRKVAGEIWNQYK